MPNSAVCKRCGGAVVAPPRATNKKFCSADCQYLWWNETRTKKVTRGEWAERRYGGVPQKQLTELEAVWLAAIIDAEGTIGIYRHTLGKNKSGHKYQAGISMANTNWALVERFRQITDCWCGVVKQSRKGPNKDVWVATVKYRNLRELLPQIIPYLIAKREQAEVVMEFLDSVHVAPMRTSSVHPKFDEFYQRTKALNKRGR